MTRRIREQVQLALAQVHAGSVSSHLESSVLDFKQEGRSRDDFVRDLARDAICFANANGGALVIGVDDRQGGPAAFSGTNLDPSILRKRIYELSEPPILVEVEEQTVAGVRLLLVFVPQGIEVHADKQGQARRRIDKDCLPMGPSDIARLREERQGFDWSAQPSGRQWTEASALAIQAARQSLAVLTDERRKYARLASDLDLLRALGVVSEQGELLRAGELLFCETALSPAIQYHYRQTPGGEPRAIERIDTPLVLAFDRALSLVRARLNQTPLSLPTGQQIDIADFPELAIREAIANALVHRDYRMRGPVLIEHSPQVFIVTSPGPLVSGVTPENILTHPPKPRNPVLARAARTLGFAEEAGRGVDRMYREMIRSGRDLPHIDAAIDQVQVKLIGGAPRTQIARFVAQLPEHEQDDTDTLLILFRLCRSRLVMALDLMPLLQKSAQEAEASLRRLASSDLAILEATRQTAPRAHPSYRLRGEVLKSLGSAVDYHRRTVDELDRKVIAHVREYERVNNRTLQNLFDVDVIRARDILSDMVERQLLVKISAQQRGPSVEYGPGPKFPGKLKAGAKKPRPSKQPSRKRARDRDSSTLPLPLESRSSRKPRGRS
ncbi:RNA-binding domain-containing protein [Myxococcus sp. RHSTA-1-4]|uniref:RNA-binding domain-containing protein n=1 Tax=Myxococcus sp. RHSTA-1-4 TaxID=2874601 RepID=UPI001CBEBECE|nr:RNA-binding domain-containing protein [Myxococcus sp. RHSTA-1-4]MBZ4421519.1 putative DNA binding domain-containing protein [Myxococcus sp. RHSTA-1-4]